MVANKFVLPFSKMSQNDKDQPHVQLLDYLSNMSLRNISDEKQSHQSHDYDQISINAAVSMQKNMNFDGLEAHNTQEPEEDEPTDCIVCTGCGETLRF